jgi:hypothetical protein
MEKALVCEIQFSSKNIKKRDEKLETSLIPRLELLILSK